MVATGPFQAMHMVDPKKGPQRRWPQLPEKI